MPPFAPITPTTPIPTLNPVTPELMLDTLDNDKLRLNRVHFRAIAMLLKQAGKADKKNNIAECRRCCVAILNFEIKYPPKHAFFPSSPLPPGEGPGVRELDDEEAPATPTTTEAPTPTSPSLREGAGGRVPASPSSPEPVTTPVSQSPSPSHRITASPSHAEPSLQPPAQPAPAPTPAPPEPAVPYEPTGELWDPSIDKDAWYAKYMKREPYKPYIHRNYLYILLLSLSVIFNSSPAFALAFTDRVPRPDAALSVGAGGAERACPSDARRLVNPDWQAATHTTDTQSPSTHTPNSHTSTTPTRHAAEGEDSVVPGHPTLIHSFSVPSPCSSSSSVYNGLHASSPPSSPFAPSRPAFISRQHAPPPPPSQTCHTLKIPPPIQKPIRPRHGLITDRGMPLWMTARN